jgi:hypothetical protein
MEKMNFFVMILVLVLAIGLVAVTYAKPQVVNVGTSAEQNTLDVSASSTASADPDIADIFVTVETISDTAAKAQDQNAATVGSLRMALQGSGLVKEVTTNSYNIYPDISYDPESGRSIVNGYIVSHSLKISTESMTGVGKILDVAVANGASTVDYVSFSLSETKAESLKQQALASAASKAREEAKKLAAASGVTLGKPVWVTENSYYQQPQTYYGGAKLAMESAAPTQVVPGEIEVTATVSINYEIA